MSAFLPRLWPIYNVIIIATLSKDAENECNKIKAKSPSMFFQIISRELAVLTYLSVAVIVYFYGYSTNITLSYIIFIFIRDLIITYIFYGGYQWFMYDSKYSEQLTKFKFNPDPPSPEQIAHDRFHTLSASLWCSLYEIAMFLMFKNNLYPNFWRYPLYSILWLEFINHCRSIYFYWSHRMMHPWKRVKIFGVDIGQYLYRNVHSLHHKSYNPSPWSGLSMHWFEHIVHFGSIIFPLIFGISQHPIHILTHKYHNLLSPIAGHDGYDFPGGGSMFHYLHHSKFECNYGTASIFWNFDKWFGTYRKQ